MPTPALALRRMLGLVLALLGVSVLSAPSVRGTPTEPAVKAPEIARPGLEWFNVAAPLPIASLRGRIVVLDFWTEGCINCMHIIPILRTVEQQYPEQVVVIGVHSPKFAEEKSAASVKDAIARYEIRHPIIHDPQLTLWDAYHVQAWPTLVIIGADGTVLGQIPGEPDPDRFGKAIGELVARAGQAGQLQPTALALQPVETPKGRFLFPGKLKPIAGASKRWALADAGHNQIVILDDSGKDVRRFGSGSAGFKDGPAATAQFNHPQGLVASDTAIFVADTSNHAIRRIDLSSGEVTTLAGTGKRGALLPTAAENGKTLALASPWDLEKKGEQLFFANAGTHQIGVLDLATDRVARFAGNGNEALQPGLPGDAAFAQPSGLTLSQDGNTLYVADAESSSIRAIQLDKQTYTSTLVGAGLFDFGHTNGSFHSARLQHALGVATDGGVLLVADTYNNRVRTLDLGSKTVSDFDGGKFTCVDPICYPLREPAGIVAASSDRILLVDTGNHRIEEFTPSSKTSHTWAQ